MYASPLMRARQTAEIINEHLNVPLLFHEGLRKITDLEVALTCQEIMRSSQTTLIVSHGEVYRVLLRILDAQAYELNARNGGLYRFRAPERESDKWIVSALSDQS